jgi:hypothetical protein
MNIREIGGWAVVSYLFYSRFGIAGDCQTSEKISEVFDTMACNPSPKF